MAYRFRDASARVTDADNSFGSHVIRKGSYWRLKLSGMNVVRLLPVNDGTGNFTPLRYSTELSDFGDWIRFFYAVKSFGNPPVTFIIADPAQETSSSLDVLPPVVLRRAIEQAVRNEQEQPGWARKLQGGAGRGPELSKPTRLYLVRGLVFQSGDQLYDPPKGFGPTDSIPVIELGASAGGELVTALNTPRQGVDPMSTPPADCFVPGDIIDPNAGRFLVFYDRHRVSPTSASAIWSTARDNPGDERARGYALDILETWAGRSPQVSGLTPDRVEPWDEIIHIPSIEEQAELVARRFPPDMILYAFRDHPEWIPSDVVAAARARRQFAFQQPQAASAPVPGYPAAGAPAYPPGVPPVPPSPAVTPSYQQPVPPAAVPAPPLQPAQQNPAPAGTQPYSQGGLYPAQPASPEPRPTAGQQAPPAPGLSGAPKAAGLFNGSAVQPSQGPAQPSQQGAVTPPAAPSVPGQAAPPAAAVDMRAEVAHKAAARLAELLDQQKQQGG